MSEIEPISGLSFSQSVEEADWGATFIEVLQNAKANNVSVCFVRVTDLESLAKKLASHVMDDSWIMALDPHSRRTYTQTVKQTAQKLVEVFRNNPQENNNLSNEFGELVVSMGAVRALGTIFSHISLPLAELWKPKKRGNEGFDFHTICTEKLINFGEAKFSGKKNPYGGDGDNQNGAGGQANKFIDLDKHYRDRPYLRDIASPEAVDNLDNGDFGIVLAFSINSPKPLGILNSAIAKAISYEHLKNAKKIYVVGVSHES